MDDGAPGMTSIVRGLVGNVVVRAHRSSGEELLPPKGGVRIYRSVIRSLSMVDRCGRPPNSLLSSLPFQPAIYIAGSASAPPKDLAASNLFRCTIRFSMSHADKQDPEKRNVMGMSSAALLCHGQIQPPIL